MICAFACSWPTSGIGMTGQRARDLVERHATAAPCSGRCRRSATNACSTRSAPCRATSSSTKLAARAYEDDALPIGHGQTISQPWVVARMTEALLETAPKKVLEVGTGPATRRRCWPRWDWTCSPSNASATCCAPRASGSARSACTMRSKARRWPHRLAGGSAVRRDHRDRGGPALVDALVAQLAPGGTGRAGRRVRGQSLLRLRKREDGSIEQGRPGSGDLRAAAVGDDRSMNLFRPVVRTRVALVAAPEGAIAAGGLSFAEAIVFPVMPGDAGADVPGPATAPRLWFATISLAFSLLGAVVGYLLGHYAYELVKPLLESLGWLGKIDAQVTHLREITAESPWKAFFGLALAPPRIPLKIFTWASGIVGIPMLPFLASMLVGRASASTWSPRRSAWAGERAERALHRWIRHRLGGVLVLLAAGIGWLLLRGHGA